MADVTRYDDAMALKSALESLLGQDEWYRLKDTRTAATWRKSLERALRVSRAAVMGTVKVADESWREEALRAIDGGLADLKTAKSLVDLFASFSACYMRLSFHQLGFMPNCRGRQTKLKAIPSAWDLSTFRSVQYVQSDAQRLRLEYSQDARPFGEKVMDPKYRKIGK